MLSLKYSTVLLATPLLVALTGRLSFAFSITPQQPGANQQYTPTVPSSSGTVELNPLSVTALPLGGTTGFLQVLNAAFPDWTVNAAPNDLAGSFSVEGYQAVYTPTSNGGNVGGQFLITYNPADNDPTTANNSLHWIQRVYTNHEITTTRDANGNITATDQGYGTNVDKIDIVTGVGGQSNPFYDTFASSPTTPGGSFYDIVGRNDPQDPNTWSGEVYLVEETSPQTVTIYNGVLWGWTNIVSGSGGGGVQSAPSARNINRELPISDIDSGDTSQLTQPTPESKSTFASAIGSWFSSLGSQNKNAGECAAGW